ncbi:PBP1A family penicillin-binding protein [Bacillus panaciterrae]|uniref:transglycosylase domain-containing protein n=1 Tax=Ectobacillus panaciterrae TaxID=363872 RepID=UPI0003F83037
MKKGAFIAGGAALIFLTACIGYFFIIFLGDFIIDEKKLVLNSTSRIVDEQGNEIAKMYVENRELVSIDQIPSHVQKAFLAAEDTRFYEHHGIDIASLVRALYKDILTRSKAEGASTITQQLAKNVFLTNEKTWLRKTKEMIIALNLERRYTKQQLLEMYLNQVYFGHGVYGMQSAAAFYFQKEPQSLTVAEGALLAGMMKAPNAYSPILHAEKGKERRNLVLSLMHKQGFLTAEETVRYQGKTLSLHVQALKKEQAFVPYIDMVFQEAADVYGLSYEEVLRGGYTFVVTLDSAMQKKAYKLFQDDQNFPKKSAEVEGAFVLMDSKSGGIKAAIGGRNYVPRGWNRVYMKRQPGSVLKPLLVYGPALETKKYKPYSLLANEKQSFAGYIPRNYNEQYSKEITMYDAIKESANVPAVWLLNEIGMETGKTYLEKGNVAIEEDGLSAALGGLKEGISPLELVKMYRAFVEEGNIVEPHVIEKIVNRKDEVIAKASQKETKIFSEQTAWYMTRMLEGAVKEGTAQAGSYEGALAGKTGTTSLPNQDNGAKDAWFVGYTPTMVGALWMGYDRTDASHYLEGGSSYPTKLFKKILTSAHTEAFASFKKPKGVKNVGEPIRLEKLESVQAKLTFTPLGLFTAKLTWKPLADKRIQYRIYKAEGDSQSVVGTVTGKGEYRIKYINVFSVPNFYVAPYNPQTEREGERTKAQKP